MSTISIGLVAFAPESKGVHRGRRLDVGARRVFKFPVTEGVGRYDLGMDHYGVKLKSGKVLWVVADHVEVREGVVLFCRKEAEGNRVLAGFVLGAIDHFGLPEAFVSAESGSLRG